MKTMNLYVVTVRRATYGAKVDPVLATYDCDAASALDAASEAIALLFLPEGDYVHVCAAAAP